MCSFSIGKDQGLCERRENLQIVDTYSHSGQWNRSVTCSSKNLNLENNQSLLWEIRSSILHSVHIQNPQLLRQIPHLFGTRACQLLSRAFQRKAHVVYSYLRGYYCDEGCFLVPRTGYFVFIASASDGCRRFIGGRWQSPAGARAADTQMILIWQLARYLWHSQLRTMLIVLFFYSTLELERWSIITNNRNHRWYSELLTLHLTWNVKRNENFNCLLFAVRIMAVFGCLSISTGVETSPPKNLALFISAAQSKRLE